MVFRSGARCFAPCWILNFTLSDNYRAKAEKQKRCGLVNGIEKAMCIYLLVASSFCLLYNNSNKRNAFTKFSRAYTTDTQNRLSLCSQWNSFTKFSRDREALSSFFLHSSESNIPLTQKLPKSR